MPLRQGSLPSAAFGPNPKRAGWRASSRRSQESAFRNSTTLKTFKTLGVWEDLIRGLEELGIKTPTAIQRDAIPFLLAKGGDFIAQAQTGTGKTAVFGIPLLMQIDAEAPEIQAVVVAPTRELAKQIGKQLFRFTKYCAQKIFVEVLTGGTNWIAKSRRCNARPRWSS